MCCCEGVYTAMAAAPGSTENAHELRFFCLVQSGCCSFCISHLCSLFSSSQLHRCCGGQLVKQAELGCGRWACSHGGFGAVCGSHIAASLLWMSLRRGLPSTHAINWTRMGNELRVGFRQTRIKFEDMVQEDFDTIADEATRVTYAGVSL